jgi:hypothetical protein
MSKPIFVFLILISSLLLVLFAVSCSEESPVSSSAIAEDSAEPASGPAELTAKFCEPPGKEGCTPGYWKNHPESWPEGLSPDDYVCGVFTVPETYGLCEDKLMDALKYGGGPGDMGAAKILLRTAVAALLNAKNKDVGYPMPASEFKPMVNQALKSESRAMMLDLKDMLDEFNNLGCPL